MKNKSNIITLLEGVTNKHILVGDIEEKNEFINVKSASLLQHKSYKETQNSSNHKTLEVPVGLYRKGKQVEYNPFTNNIEEVFD